MLFCITSICPLVVEGKQPAHFVDEPSVSEYCCSESSKLHYQVPSMLDFLGMPDVLSLTEKIQIKSVSSKAPKKMLTDLHWGQLHT